LTPGIVRRIETRWCYLARHEQRTHKVDPGDNVIFARCCRERFAIITANGKDYTRLCHQMGPNGVHHGLIILYPGSLTKQDQLNATDAALTYIERRKMVGTTNWVIRVRPDKSKPESWKVDKKRGLPL